jgi:hypothetical protein
MKRISRLGPLSLHSWHMIVPVRRHLKETFDVLSTDVPLSRAQKASVLAPALYGRNYDQDVLSLSLG